MEMKDYILREIKRHPSAEGQDIAKLCYQAAFGAEHLLLNPDSAREYLQKEFDSVDASSEPLSENISDSFCRVNLRAWKAEGLPLEWLFRMFALTAECRKNGTESYYKYLEEGEKASGFSLLQFRNAPPSPLHHSEQYRKSEKPSYRIVNRQLLRLIPLLRKVHAEKPSVIAIDGRAASGKTTAAAHLSRILDAELIHMDDFFLPPALRSEERLAEAGGNVHYERFIEEVLPHLSSGEEFSYRIFDCGIMDFGGRRTVKSAPLRIVEGSYSCHPKFGKYADITVFSYVTPEEQMRRIIERNGEKMAEMFRSRWIPMEEEYFEHYSISDNADIILL